MGSLQVTGANVRSRDEEGECSCGWPLYVGDSCRWLVENGEDVAGPFCSTTCAEDARRARVCAHDDVHQLEDGGRICSACGKSWRRTAGGAA